MLNRIEFNSNSNDKTNKKWSAGGWGGVLTAVRDGRLTALRITIRVEYELVQDTGQTTANDRSQPINLQIYNKKKLTLISLVQCI